MFFKVGWENDRNWEGFYRFFPSVSQQNPNGKETLKKSYCLRAKIKDFFSSKVFNFFVVELPKRELALSTHKFT
jgi:hypothetical protein